MRNNKARAVALGANIGAARVAAGMNVQELARRAKVRVGDVVALESGTAGRRAYHVGLDVIDELGIDWDGRPRHDGAPLRAIREAKGLTVAAVARAAGISAGQVRRIESPKVRNARSTPFVSYVASIGVDLNEGFRLAGFRHGRAAPVLA